MIMITNHMGEITVYRMDKAKSDAIQTVLSMEINPYWTVADKLESEGLTFCFKCDEEIIDLDTANN